MEQKIKVLIADESEKFKKDTKDLKRTKSEDFSKNQI